MSIISSVDKAKIEESPQKFNIIPRLLLIIFTLYIFFLIILNSFVVIEKSVLKYSVIVIPVFALSIFIAHKRSISPKAFLIGIFTAAFISKALIVIVSHTQPVSDFKMFYDCAVALVNGRKGWSQWDYFSDWAYQTGPITYYAILMKIFGTGLLPLQLCNCFFMAGTNTFIYLIARKISNEGAARSAAFLYLFYPAPYFLAPVLTNQHFAACMFFAAIYILMLDTFHFAIRGVLGGIIAALGNAVRPLGVVVIAAFIVWGIIELIRAKKIINIGIVLIMTLAYSISTWGISSYLIHEDISPYGLANNFPLWKFVVGLNEKSVGQYSLQDQTDIFFIKDKIARDDMAKRTIKERLSIGPKSMTIFMIKKQAVMWASVDTLKWGFYAYKDNALVPPENFGVIENRVLKTEKMYYFTALLVLTFGMIIMIIRKKNIASLTQYIMLLLMAYFAVHIFIEIQVRYRYFAMISVFILLSFGVQYFVEGCKALKIRVG